MSEPVAGALSLFDPVVARWFRERVGTPTDVQEAAWPEIAAGRHVLATAPTGSGKTLTAFLWALDRLLAGHWAGGTTRVLYVSPLKALNNDIRENLLRPLAELQEAFEAAGREPGTVSVMTRSGDTPANERQRMTRRPPEILITTPESLNILLTSRGGRAVLDGVATVILDEIHAVAGSKRGTHLITAVERLVPLAGEFQRLALSATVRPVERVARFVGGWQRGEGDEPVYRPRDVRIVSSRARKRYELEVRTAEPVEAAASPTAPLPGDAEANVWDGLTREIKARIRANRSTLVFANSRRTTEKLTRLLNEGEPADLVYSHHGSLSREIRQAVERRLRDGELAGIVATNSLELGIDIGALDEVVMVQTPPTVASAVQRVGRAGHRVGEVSRGRLFPLFERDLLDAAVVVGCVREGAIEEVRPPEAPLDVLAQVVLSAVATEPWPLDELYALVRQASPYRDLPRRSFDLVVEMLAGRYADTRVRELAPRVTIDRLAGTVQGRPGAARAIYLSGGTIPDRGYYHLRLADSMARLGELDEEFVWERSLGDTFTLGAQSWRIRRITHNDVLVAPARRGASMAPFWRAEARNRGAFLSERIADLLAFAEEALSRRDGRPALAERLEREHAMTAEAAEALVELLERQRAETGAALPHARHLLAEWTSADGGEGRSRRVILHAPWGGKALKPWAIALEAACEERLGLPLGAEHDNDCLTFAPPEGVELAEILQWVRSDNLEELLRRRLERTGFFGARFRESAGRALLLPRGDFRRRVPLWLNRQRAKKLLEAVASSEDFPVLVETWRTCLRDDLDLEALKSQLDRLAAAEIEVDETTTLTPSPFAAGLTWKETNRLMYEDDTPEGGPSKLSGDLLREVVFASRLRPQLPESLLDSFERKLQRTWPGYAPDSAPEVLAWIEERVALPLAEWEELLAARRRDRAPAPDDTEELLEELGRRALLLRLPGGETGLEGPEDQALVVAGQGVPRLLRALGVGIDGVELAPFPGVDRLDPALVEAVRAWAVAPPEESARQAEAGAAQHGAGEEGGESGEDAFEELLAEWLRFYGPIAPQRIEAALGVGGEVLERALAALVEGERVVVDRFRRADPEREEVCDAENLERLLRALRAASRPEFTARPLDELPLFLAHHQGIARPGEGIEGLQASLESLFGYPAPARLWETELLPARLDPYYPVWLDSVMQESELLWLGCGEEKLTFLFASDVDLVAPEAGSAALPDALARRLPPDRPTTVEELALESGLSSGEVAAGLWRAAWNGVVTTREFRPVRHAILSGFAAAAPIASLAGARRPSARRGFDRWKTGRAVGALWEAVERGPEPADAIEREELARERARLLVARYGVLFRELVQRELPALAWSEIFRALRLMELSGEVLAGHFFEGPLGPQFASPAAFRRLREGLERDVVFWVNALDPAAPCGLGLEAWKGRFPSRLPSTHLVFHGTRPVVVSRRGGAVLEIDARPGDPRAGEILAFLGLQLTRAADPRTSLDVETIDGAPAAESPWAAWLAERFDLTREPGGLRLRRRYAAQG
ncbi:MAG: DEAD/DEAH box helicase [Thermoanaerobaculia bacterium]